MNNTVLAPPQYRGGVESSVTSSSPQETPESPVTPAVHLPRLLRDLRASNFAHSRVSCSHVFSTSRPPLDYACLKQQQYRTYLVDTARPVNVIACESC